MMKWEAEQKGYTCNDCYLSMQNCHDKSICCEDETGLCDYFEEMMNDLVSRLSEIRSNYNCFDENEEPYYRALSEAIQLVSARTGKWIEYDNSHCECPFCHEEWSYFDNEVECFNYCPNCGARMES